MPSMSVATLAAEANATGTSLNGGTLRVYTGSKPANTTISATGTLLATLTFPSPAFATTSTAVATANSIVAVTAVATGTAGWCRLTRSDGTTVVMDGTVSAQGGAGEIGITVNGAPSATITVGDSVSVSSLTYTRQ